VIILIAGASHAGKTVLAQKLLEQYHYPYLSIDHLKMGLIRSGNTNLTPCDDEALKEYLWPIVREMIKTAIENNQNLIVEGCYIPYNWAESFEESYRRHIRAVWLIMAKEYIESHFDDILAHASDVEQRLDDSGCTMQWLIEENQKELSECIRHNCRYVLIERDYHVAEAANTILSQEGSVCV
jgi:adenylate kinase family enzyme